MVTGITTLIGLGWRYKMKIKFLGHASFLIETKAKSIIMDPFDEEVGYKIYEKDVDYVTVSHDHWDHNGVHLLKGTPTIINTLGSHSYEGINFNGIASYHDQDKGSLRGENIIYKLEAEGISLVHLGDLGHLLSEEQMSALGEIDILFIPVGGTFTIDAKEAFDLVKQLQPKIVIPMHYQTPHLSFTLAPVEDFTSRFDIVIKKPFLDIKPTNLAAENQIIILDYLS